MIWLDRDLASLAAAQAWQVTALVLAVLLATRRWTHRRPHLACVLWLLVLIKCLTPPLWSAPSGLFCWVQTAFAAVPEAAVPLSANAGSRPATVVAEPSPIPRPKAVAEDAITAKVDALHPAPHSPAGPNLDDASAAAAIGLRRFLLTLWLVGTGVLVTLTMWRCWRSMRALRHTALPHAAAYDELVARLSRQLGMRGRVRLWVTSSRCGPAVVGLFRPVIVLPELVVQGKQPEDLEAILAHELIHVRRGDLWLGLLQATAKATWWFHPLVWLAARLSAREAERCCDEEVVGSLGCDPARYARSLLEILELKRTLQPVPAFPGMKPVDVTSQRLERIMQLRQGCRRRTPWWCWMVLVLTAAATLPGAAWVGAEEEPDAKSLRAPSLGVDGLLDDGAPRPGNRKWAAWDLQRDGIIRTYPVDDVVAAIRRSFGEDESIALRWLALRLVGSASDRPVTVSIGSDQLPTTPLELTASEDGHRRIADELNRIRKHGTAEMTIEIRFVTAAPQLIKTAVADWQIQPPQEERHELAADCLALSASQLSSPNASATRTGTTVTTQTRLPVLVKIVDDRQAELILDTLRGDSLTNVLAAPKLTIYSGQFATVFDQSQRLLVVGVKDGEPQTRLVPEGMRINLRPLLRGDKVRLEFELRGLEITDVAKTAVKAAGRAEELTLEIPEVRETKVESAIELPLGKTLILNGPEFRHTGKKPQSMLVTMRIQRVAAELQIEQTKRQPPTCLGINPDVDVVGPVVIDKTPPYPRPTTPTVEREPEHAEPDPDDHYVLVHNVADLVGAVGWATAVTQEQRARSGAVMTAALDQLVRRVRSEISADTWDSAGGPGSIAGFSTNLSLIVSQTPRTHLAIHEYLNNLRKQEGLPPNPKQPQFRRPPRDAGAVQTRVYSVADLVIPRPTSASSTMYQPIKPDFSTLIDLITSTIAPSSWSDVGGVGTMTTVPINLSLVIAQTASVHQQIAELLEELRRLQDVQVTIETKFLGLPERLFELIGRDFPGADGPAEDGSVLARQRWIPVSGEDASRLLNACQGDDRVKILQAPKLTLFNAQLGRVAWQDRGAKITLQYQGVVAADGKFVQLTVMLGEGEPGSSSRTCSVRVPDGSALLLDATDELQPWADAQSRNEDASLLDGIPYVSRFLSNPPQRRSDHVVLLITPRVVVVKDEPPAVASPRQHSEARR